VTAEQYEAQNKGMVSVTDDTVRMLADGIAATCTLGQRAAHHVTRASSHSRWLV
jgi:hypothetical protein